jgi:lysophospholipase L1-like esterase
VLSGPADADEPAPFELRHGDRVVLIGSTFVERADSHGYIEMALTARYPRRNLLFRNLGWSGDTVSGDARAGFDNAQKGFERLVEHVLALEPTVLVIGYGTNESFAGPEGLQRFKEGLDGLLEKLEPTKARLVFISPLKHEALGRPLPDPTAHNRDLEQYCEVLRAAAAARGGTYVDLFNSLGAGAEAALPGPLTDNGMHLTGYGYWRAAQTIERLLGLPDDSWQVALSSEAQLLSAAGTTVSNVQAADGGLRFRVEDERLPLPLPPNDGPLQGSARKRQRVLTVQGLAEGNYALQIDGQTVVVATAAQWDAGMPVESGPDYEHAEALRRAILRKNELHFHRWRPQNETYLFGFRKHEQGQNAREIPLFDPLVSVAESAVAGLRIPTPHEYAIVPQ